MADTQSPTGLLKRRRNGLGTVAQDKTRQVKKSTGQGETHASRPHGDRTTPRAIKSASEAAMDVARILIENIQRGSDRDPLEARLEVFNTVDHANNPAANE
ncbi:hypothetical protein J7337_013912 [Fusarium musae]|uniref:Uncharacterized protein n=1 Tax=Fusarium musae TaxID=1042133 RepID=A0A9P8D3S4_9HYPO|nr:hypothetical protein J7337_013912 [Fusarium musae]KAG9494773.1 hypothetical protein J7337_013912 [Fusarium musae]